MKKTPIFVLCTLLVLVLLSGCEDKAMMEEMEAAKTELAEVKSQLATALQDNKGLSETIEGLKAKVMDVEAVTKAKASLEKQIETMMAEKEAMTKQLSDAKGKVTSLMEKVKEYSAKVEELQLMINELKAGPTGAVEEAVDAVKVPNL